MNDKILSIIIEAQDRADDAFRRVNAELDMLAAKADLTSAQVSIMNDRLNNTGNNSNKLDKLLKKAFTDGADAARQFATIAAVGLGVTALSVTALGVVSSAAFALFGGGLTAITGGLLTLGLVAAAQNSKVKSALSDMASDIKSKFEQAVEPLQPLLISFAKNATSTFDSIAPEISTTFEQYKPIINNFLTGVLQGFKNFTPAITNMFDALEPVFDNLSRRMGDLGSFATQQSNIIIDAFGSVSDYFTGSFLNGLGDLITGLDDLLADFIKIGAQMSGPFLSAVGQVLQQFGEKLLQSFEKNRLSIENVMVDIVKIAGAILDVIPSIVSFAAELEPLFNFIANHQWVIEALVASFVLFKVASAGIKLASFIGDLKKVSSIAGFLPEILGGIGASGEGATGILAGLGAVLTGPVGLGIAATVVAGAGAYLAYKHFSGSVKDTTDQIKNLYPWLNYTNISLDRTKDLQSDISQTQKAIQKQEQIINQNRAQSLKINQTVADTADAYQKAQNAVNGALDKYGQNSPQYQAAAEQLTGKYDAFIEAQQTSVGLSLDEQINEGKLVDMRKALKTFTDDLATAQNGLNIKLGDGLGIISKYGSTAIEQTKGIAVLQNSLNGVIATFKSIKTVALQSIDYAGDLLQGLGSKIQNVQNAISGTRVQGSSIGIQGGSVSLQGGHATGTNYALGGPSLVGEQGPEIVNLPKGSQVIPNKYLGGSQQSSTVNIYGNISLGSKDAVDQFFTRLNAQRTMAAYGVGV